MTTLNFIPVNPDQGQVVVANRGTGNLTLINEQNGTVIDTIDLPVGA